MRNASTATVRSDQENQEDEPEGQVNAQPQNHILPRLVLVGLVLLVMLLLSAPSALASEGCPNEALRAESNTHSVINHEPYDMGLPECRAYEMVSPLNKQGLEVLQPGI